LGGLACDPRRHNEFSERRFGFTRKRPSLATGEHKEKFPVMMKKLYWLTLSSLLMLGCGGPSQPSIDHSKKLSALSASERQDACGWAASTLGGDGHEITCKDKDGNSAKVTIKTDDCIDSFRGLSSGCTATYGDFADCADAQTHDFCGGAWLTKSSCVALRSCGMN
jgi:hypothetical protein